jgi:X-Pro dipeptidyl-peptidase
MLLVLLHAGANALSLCAVLDTDAPKATHSIVDGQAQVVEAFKDKSQWIKQWLWVETDFDSDGDGRKDRVHVDVTRPRQTETEGLKVPVIYETSPYFAGTGPDDKSYFWDPNQELGAAASRRHARGPCVRRHRSRSPSRPTATA